MEASYAMMLGVRGSVPISGASYADYGGATTCVLLHLAGQYVVLDAGTGILCLPQEALDQPALPLLLTHAHLDHVNGLSMCPYVFSEGKSLDIYASLSGHLNAEEVLQGLYSPPLWPVLPSQFAASLAYHALPEELEIGPIHVSALDGVHPGGVKLLRLRGGGKTVVFATDCTLTESLFSEVAEFARDCDLLLCDGQYSDAEWPQRSGFGHNTWTRAAELGNACHAKTVRIVHHDPNHTDAVLHAAEAEVLAISPVCRFAFEGEVIRL